MAVVQPTSPEYFYGYLVLMGLNVDMRYGWCDPTARQPLFTWLLCTHGSGHASLLFGI